MARSVSTQQQTGPYGSWRSPVTADAIVAGVIGLGQIQLDGDDIYWVEQRPSEAGRNVVVRRRPDGSIADGVCAATVLVYAGARIPLPRGHRLVLEFQRSASL